MNTDTPDHRAGFTTRSGDTHVIGGEDHAEAVNIDQQARDAAAAEAAKAAKPSSPKTPRKRSKPTKARQPVAATEVGKAAESPPSDAGQAE